MVRCARFFLPVSLSLLTLTLSTSTTRRFLCCLLECVALTCGKILTHCLHSLWLPRYQEDLFGLKTVDEAGKIVFNSTNGDHLEFSEEQLSWWVDNYFVE